SARPSQAAIDQFRRMRQQAGDGAPRERPPGAGGGGGEGLRWSGGGAGGGGGGRGGGGFGGGRQGGRLTLSAYHSWLLKDEVRIRPGLPVLDYLGGEAADGGARSRHQVEVDAGWFNNGLGARLSADWRSGSTVRGGRSGTLDFAPLATVDVKLFANLGERFDLVAKYPWLRGSQVRLGVDNIFDAKQKVRDAAGFVPVNYQPDLLDPQGRTVMISIRKLFLPRFGTGRGSARRP
ncbi:MAG: TonB-dependent receptor, partial [Sphingomicrobium sp.]